SHEFQLQASLNLDYLYTTLQFGWCRAVRSFRSMGSSSSFQRRSFISLLFFLPAVAYASAPQRPTCVRSAAIETKLHAHPSATVYAESGAWFKAGNKFECAARDYREAAKLDP